MYDITNKVVIVTGGASGIGACIVRDFLEAGAKNVVIFDINSERCKAYKMELVAKYGPKRAKFIICDVTTSELDAAFNVILEDFKHVDIVVNNAGIFDDSLKGFKQEITVNFTAVVASSMKAFNLMRKDRGGSGGTVINISSVLALTECSLSPIYSATKSAVFQFTKCLGMEPHYSRSGVRFITVCFGLTETEMPYRTENKIDEETEEDFTKNFSIHSQRPESAAKGVTEAYRRGATASTWLVTCDRPAEDISNRVREAYHILEQRIYE